MRAADCATWRERISAALDGELLEHERHATEEHLGACTSCRSWRNDAEILHRAVRVRRAEPVPDLTEPILAAGDPRLSRHRLNRRARALVAAAALAIPLGAIVEHDSAPLPPALSVDAVASAPAGHTGAIYMTIVNDGGSDELVGAVARGASHTAIHDTVVVDAGLVAMKERDGHEIRRRSTTTMGPGGAHLMLYGLGDPVEPGDTISVRLRFARSQDLQLEVPVVHPSDLTNHLMMES